MLRSRPYAAGRSAETHYRQAQREWRDLPLLRWKRIAFLALATAGYTVEVLWMHHLGAWLPGIATALCLLAYTALSN